MRIKMSSAKKIKTPSNPLPLKSSEPRSGFRENKQYEEDLYAGLDNADVRTIALAGVYGSGKSSILKSIKRKKLRRA